MNSNECLCALEKFLSILRTFVKGKLFLWLAVVLLPSLTYADRMAVYPCVDFQAIRWVRDATYCDQYYICHFGQPMSMPSCPVGQVWSNLALNCVPVHSRWDDCSHPPVPTPQAYPTIKVKTQGEGVELPTYRVNNLLLPGKDVVVSTSRPKSSKQRVVKQEDTRVNSTTTQVPIRVIPLKQNSIPLVQRLEVSESKETGTKNSYRAGSPTQRRRNEDKPDRREKQLRYTTTPPQTTTPTSTPAPIVKSTRAPIRAPTRLPFYPADTRQHNRRQQQENSSMVPSTLEAKLRHLDIDRNHPCLRNPGALFPHPENCHWYINCSLANLEDEQTTVGQEEGEDTTDDTGEGFYLLQPFRVRSEGVFVWECRFPQLFDDVTNKCREFVNVNCKSRFEPVDQCEYSARQQCRGGRCVPCERRFGRCRGRENGVYPVHQDKWTPLFVSCYLQRNIALDECIPPTPIFSPEALDCVSLFEVPKQHGGFLPDCSTRADGYYPDEQGRCAIFFRCALGNFRGYDECPPGSVFDPAIPSCQPYSFASRPCGEGQAPLCGGKQDGLYADPYGRCTHYFECKKGAFQQYSTCDLGVFDPLTQKCVISMELTVRPCGLQPSPCETLPSGVYPDQATGCQNFIECQRGVMLTNGTCSRGTVFSALTGRCDIPENAPPPCGVSATCIGRPDGRYPALGRGCSYFYECYHGEFISLRRCTASDGGFFFNPATGECDYPQNICPPCGYKWWGCDRTYQI